ncbi:MAG TPA: bifunctional UDP-N-acetylglucosamine diphosphorylase/glucosamine-1-phosphate N-acetyltransferase GlmU [Gaiellaceae bacterium]|nr:bifunctional UDP-N-acetylglucosamine diphosphorylase/glucosamine-1-phosphate N-acetyltransferase GlmU [Gaiellaceae bacterium]
MTQTPLAAVVMAAGLGTRMRSSRPKHLHPLLGRRLVDWAIAAAGELGPDPLVVVTSPGTMPELDGTLPSGVALAVQETPRGTGDAAASARPALEGFAGDVLVLAGDAPLLSAAELRRLLEVHRAEGAAATVLSFEPADPGAYGRVLRDGAGRLRAIVEAGDATSEELAVREVNSSVYAFAADALWHGLARLDTDNSQGELYLTDAVRHLVDDGRAVAVYRAEDPRVGEGVNTRADLAAAAGELRDQIVAGHLEAGVTVVDPATTWIEPEVELEPDTVIHPFTVLRGRTVVRRGAEVGPHAVLVDAEVGEEALVGPFCYLRPGTVLAARAKAGTFVELKNSRIGEGTKVPHLSYLGDAEVGEGTNVGAGTITANLPHQPGREKGRTTIGRNVRTGIHNGLEAPVTIGDGAWIGGGSYITEDVPSDSLAIARARQVTKEGYLRGKRND